MLKMLLRLNAASCLGFGGVFVFAPGAVVAFLGAPPTGVVVVLGLVLLVNGGHLIHASSRAARAVELRWFALGDFAWVAGTMLLVVGRLWITTPGGAVAALAVAAMVGSFGILQWRLADETVARVAR